jgi:rubredoxin
MFSEDSRLLQKFAQTRSDCVLKAVQSKLSPIEESEIMLKYVCTVCNYVYDAEIGDPDNGIPPGTPFDELPDDWICPICGATPEEFEQE